MLRSVSMHCAKALICSSGLHQASRLGDVPAVYRVLDMCVVTCGCACCCAPLCALCVLLERFTGSVALLVCVLVSAACELWVCGFANVVIVSNAIRGQDARAVVWCVCTPATSAVLRAVPLLPGACWWAL